LLLDFHIFVILSELKRLCHSNVSSSKADGILSVFSVFVIFFSFSRSWEIIKARFSALPDRLYVVDIDDSF